MDLVENVYSQGGNGLGDLDKCGGKWMSPRNEKTYISDQGI